MPRSGVKHLTRIIRTVERSINETTGRDSVVKSWTILLPNVILPKLPEPHVIGLSILLFLFDLVYTELLGIRIFDT